MSQEFSLLLLLLFKHRIKLVIYNLFYVVYYRWYASSIIIITGNIFKIDHIFRDIITANPL
jgi:hypothetical protein